MIAVPFYQCDVGGGDGGVLQLPEGGDFGTIHCQPSRTFDRSTKLDLTTEPPLLGRCCWAQYLFAFLYFVVSD